MGSLLRDVRYDPRLDILTVLPINEYASLRLEPPVTAGATSVDSVGPSLGIGRQFDISVTFAIPAVPSERFGVSLLRSADGTRKTDVLLLRTPNKGGWQLLINTTMSGEVTGHANKYPVAQFGFSVLPEERELTLRVVLDRSIVEAFAQGGRAVVTATAYAAAANSAVNVVNYGKGNVTLVSATAWKMGCAWKDHV